MELFAPAFLVVLWALILYGMRVYTGTDPSVTRILLLVSFAVIYVAAIGSCLLAEECSTRIVARFAGNAFWLITFVIEVFGKIFATIGLHPTAASDPAYVDHSPDVAIYFSIITWTTVGYGDFVPTPSGRFYAAAEAFLGYIFMGVALSAAFYLIGKGNKNPR